MADNGTIGRNPFAIKTSTTPSRGSEDQARESRPLVAPPTLVLSQDTPRSSGFVLKPSALSAQTSNLKIYNTPTSLNNGKAESKDGDRVSDNSNDKKKDSENKEELDAKVELDAKDGEKKETELDTAKQSAEDGESEKKDESDKNDPNVPEASTKNENAKSDEKSSQDSAETVKPEAKITVPIGAAIDNAKKPNEIVFGQSLENRVSNVPESSFVFGQNLRDRVTNAETRKDSPVEEKSEAPTDFAEAASVNAEPENQTESPAKGEKRSLNETAEEYQQRMENEAKKSRFEEVEVVTGEEDERNVVQINCKLYIFEGNQYLERGRGVLRLNDKQNPEDGSLQSRVVMRTQGILRVVLNTKVWAGMTVEYANDRSLRMTAHSAEGTSAVYLIQCSTREAEQLYSALEWRVQALKNGQAGNSRDEEANVQFKGDQDNTDSNSNTIG